MDRKSDSKLALMNLKNQQQDGGAVFTSIGKRKRGAQPNNRNAFKHGFYSEQFKQTERENLSRIKNTDLNNEIEMMRVQIFRYLEAEGMVLDQIDYEMRIQALRTVSLAAESLTRLIRTQVILNSDSPKLEKDENNDAPSEDVFD